MADKGRRGEEEAGKVQAQFQEELDKFTKAQKKNDKLMRLNGQLETQLHENEMVRDELQFCKDGARVYKLIGDVLVPQTLEEAKSNVVRRIEYIQNESKRNQDLIGDNKTELAKLRENVSSLEQQIQRMQIDSAAPK